MQILVLLVLLIIFIIVVSIFFKLLATLAKAIAYAIILFAVVGIIFIFFVHGSFTNFVSELDRTNLYLYQDGEKILFGYQDNPFKALTGTEIARINNNIGKFSRVKREKEIFNSANNIIIYNRKALELKKADSFIFNDVKYTSDQISEAKDLLLSGSLGITDRGNLFALIVQEWNSDFFYPQYRERSMDAFPKRLMLGFIDNSPKFLLKLFGFERKFRGAENGKSV